MDVQRAALVLLGIALAQLRRLVERHPGGDVAVERVVRGGLVGHEVHARATAHDLREDLGGVAEQADAARDALRLVLLGAAQRLVQIGDHLVEVAGVEPPLDARRVHLHREADALVHRDGERLRAAHAAQAARQRIVPLSEPPYFWRAASAKVS